MRIIRNIKPMGLFAFIGVMTAMLAGCGYDNSSKDMTKIDVDKYVTSIGDYSNLSVEVDAKNEVSEEDVQNYIDYVLSGQTETVKSDKTVVEEGDIVNIDYEGIKDGVALTAVLRRAMT